MLEVAVPTLVPIFLMIALGWGLRARHVFPDAFFTGLNTLTFYISLPALLLVRIAVSPIEPGPAARIFLALLAATAMLVLLAYPLARLFRLGGPGTASFVQASMRGNLAYIGLPVIFYALSSRADGAGGMDIEATAMLVLAPLVPVYNLACVIILSHGTGAEGTRPSVGAVTLKIIGNPLLIGCLLGLVLALSGAGLPVPLVRTLQPLGQTALPLALLSLGSSFTRGGLHRHVAPALGSSLLKVAVAPLLGLLFSRWLQLAPQETQMVLIFLACPSAVASYVMAEQMGADADLAGGAVVLSTLLSIIPLALILMLN